MKNKELKKCKYCASEIPKEAKICPVCKKDVSNNLLIGSIILIVIFIWITYSL
jgi:RNA polymerase subunit RPABC4/transcription elongation factor Spt4